MKHPLTLLAACALLLTVPALPACTPAVPPAQAETDTAAATDTAALMARIEAYKDMVNDLQSAILELKQSDYVARAEYEARIAALLSEIDTLKNGLNPPDTSIGADISVSGTPTEPPADTHTPNDQPPSMAFHYEIRDGHAVILAYLGDQTHVTVPAVIEGYPVTSIEDSAFQGTTVVTVELPYSVSAIGWFAFADCASLTSVTLPASVEAIGYGAFDNCPALTVHCPADSYAAQYASSFGLPHTEA